MPPLRALLLLLLLLLLLQLSEKCGKQPADVVDVAGLTPLLVAAQCGNAATLRVLLEVAEPPADIHFAHRSDGTALIHAAARGHKLCVQYLLEKGAGALPSEADAKKDGKKHKSKSKHKHKHKKADKEAKDELPTGGINARDLAKCTALTRAAIGGYHEIVVVLAEAGADVDPKGRADETPMLMCSRLGYYECVRELLEAGADPEAENHWGESALDIAKEEEQDEVIELLLNALGMDGSEEDEDEDV